MDKDTKVQLGMSKDTKVQLGMSKDAKVQLGMSKEILSLQRNARPLSCSC